MKKIIIILNTIFIILISVPEDTFCNTDQIIKYQRPGVNLDKKWDWAMKHIKNQPNSTGYWIGYSFKQFMDVNSFINGYHCHDYDDKKTLEEIIYGRLPENMDKGKSDTEIIREAAKEALKQYNDNKKSKERVEKEIAVLFRFMPDKPVFNDIKLSNLSLYADLKNIPLIWLGKNDSEQSLNFLKQMYNRQTDDNCKNEILVAIGIHEMPKRVIPFLQKILYSNESNELREDAVFWIARQNDEKSLEILINTANSDRSLDVREKAVFGISLLNSDAAIDALISLVYHEQNSEVRKKAVFWLGQKASKKAVAALDDVVHIQNGETEIQKQAVFALSQIPKDEGIPYLIKIAKEHPNKMIRKKAIFWLGQSNDPRAIDAIVEMIKN